MVTFPPPPVRTVWTAWSSSSSSSSVKRNRSKDASLTALFSQYISIVLRKRKDKKKKKRRRKDLSQILDCIYFHVYIICREEKQLPCYHFNPVLFLRKSDFCCSDYSRRLNPNVCMLQHANCLRCPPPNSTCANVKGHPHCTRGLKPEERFRTFDAIKGM